MSTYGNVSICGKEFSVSHIGGDKAEIRELVREYVQEIRGKVKPEYLATAVVNAIASEAASDYYAPFHIGFCEPPAYQWEVSIGPRGGVKIRAQQRGKDEETGHSV